MPVPRTLRIATFTTTLAIAVASSSCASLTPAERAQSLARQHREDEGIRVLRQQLREHPDDLASRRLLVRLLAYTADLNGARAEIAELEARLPKGDTAPWIELGHAFELAHRFEEALAAYDTASQIAPESPAGPREGGMRCARWGESEEAARRLEDAIKRGANDPVIFHTLGLVRVHLQDLGGADRAYTAGLAVEPKGTLNLLGLATVAILRDDAAAALSAYARILARRPDFAPAELGRAWALAKLGRKDDARRSLDRAEALGAPRENVQKQRAALKE